MDKIIKEEFQSDVSKKIIYIDHHLSHINSAFLISDFDECLSVSIDGFEILKAHRMEFQKITKQRFLEIYISHILLEYFIKA